MQGVSCLLWLDCGVTVVKADAVAVHLVSTITTTYYGVASTSMVIWWIYTYSDNLKNFFSKVLNLVVSIVQSPESDEQKSGDENRYSTSGLAVP